MQKKQQETLGLYGLAMILLWPLALWWQGWAASTLWAWFIVPHFCVAALPVGVAIGMLLLARLASGHRDHLKPYDQWSHEEKLNHARTCLIGMAYRPALALLVGWLTLRLF